MFTPPCLVLFRSPTAKFNSAKNRLNIHTKNEEMNMFPGFQLNMTFKRAKMRTPIILGDPSRKWGFHKRDEISFSQNFCKKVFIQHKVDVQSMQIVKNEVMKRNILPLAAIQKWLFLHFVPYHFFQNASSQGCEPIFFIKNLTNIKVWAIWHQKPARSSRKTPKIKISF